MGQGSSPLRNPLFDTGPRGPRRNTLGKVWEVLEVLEVLIATGRSTASFPEVHASLRSCTKPQKRIQWPGLLVDRYSVPERERSGFDSVKLRHPLVSVMNGQYLNEPNRFRTSTARMTEKR